MMALSHNNKKINVTEPFKGLFTQGMVCHETYKDEKNNWISPDEIININGKKVLKKNQALEVKVGPSESMSKSKKNTIDPQKIIENYGADSARLFILSDSPPEKDIQWSDEGIKSSYKFIQRLWLLNDNIMEEIARDHPKDSGQDISRFTNLFIKKMTNNLSLFNYNVLVANLHELYNYLNKEIKNKYTKKTLEENYEKILTSMIPIIPHFAMECIEKNQFKINQVWPSYDEGLLEEKEVHFVVQINGKKRALIKMTKDLDENKVLDNIKYDKNIAKHLFSKKIRKTIFVKNKLINIII
tara:strand:+ start:27 stop:923 length:897 start_codon:yes stop_codon:yes gene_type:complete